jgi:hypothetical protein
VGRAGEIIQLTDVDRRATGGSDGRSRAVRVPPPDLEIPRHSPTVAELAIDRSVLQEALKKVMTLARSRQIVVELRESFSVSERRACRALRLPSIPSKEANTSRCPFAANARPVRTWALLSDVSAVSAS